MYIFFVAIIYEYKFYDNLGFSDKSPKSLPTYHCDVESVLFTHRLNVPIYLKIYTVPFIFVSTTTYLKNDIVKEIFGNLKFDYKKLLKYFKSNVKVNDWTKNFNFTITIDHKTCKIDVYCMNILTCSVRVIFSESKYWIRIIICYC